MFFTKQSAVFLQYGGSQTSTNQDVVYLPSVLHSIAMLLLLHLFALYLRSFYKNVSLQPGDIYRWNVCITSVKNENEIMEQSLVDCALRYFSKLTPVVGAPDLQVKRHLSIH